MNPEAVVRTAVPVLAQYGTIDSSVLLARLIAARVPRAEAIAAIRFVPLAFGRALLDGMGVVLADTYSIRDEERPLAGEPIFVAAQRLTTAFPPDVFTAVAMQSSELAAINAALNAGVDPSGLVAGSPTITSFEDEPDAPPAAAKKPWWKLWS